MTFLKFRAKCVVAQNSRWPSIRKIQKYFIYCLGFMADFRGGGHLYNIFSFEASFLGYRTKNIQNFRFLATFSDLIRCHKGLFWQLLWYGCNLWWIWKKFICIIYIIWENSYHVFYIFNTGLFVIICEFLGLLMIFRSRIQTLS